MKAFSLLPLFLLVLACTSESDGPRLPDDGSISFQTAKSLEARTSLADLERFNVWGWANDPDQRSTMVFSNQEVVNENGQWTYSPLIYWFPNRTHRFWALATNKSQASGLTITEVRPSFSDWEQVATMSLRLNEDYDEDVVYASAERTTSSSITQQLPVDLTFFHVLAKLTIQVKSADIPGCSLRLTSLTFKPKSNGCTFAPDTIMSYTVIPPPEPGGTPTIASSYKVRTHVLTSTPNTSTKTLLPANPAGHQTPYISPAMYLVPGEAGTITVTYELWQDSPAMLIRSFTETYNPTGLMQAGTSYQATIAMPSASTVISLNATIDPWGDDNDTDREILSI